MKIPQEVGSKYRFIILAGQRVSQLQKGAKPRIDDTEKMKHTQIAVEELEADTLKFSKLIMNEDGSIKSKVGPDGTKIDMIPEPKKPEEKAD